MSWFAFKNFAFLTPNTPNTHRHTPKPKNEKKKTNKNTRLLGFPILAPLSPRSSSHTWEVVGGGGGDDK